jgi:glycosyltransferase involved in cell wall biosynthesis
VHLIALVEGPDHVCCRYRLAAYRSVLEAAGHHLEVRPFPRSAWGRLTLGADLRHADLVVVQRRLPTRWQTALLRRRVRRLAFDFDDAVWLRDSYAPRGLTSGRRQRRFGEIVRVADVVLAGNNFLRTAALRWAHSDRVAVVPTVVEPAHYPLASHARCGEGVRLVWVGSSSTLRGLDAARPLLEAVGLVNPGVRLRLVCDRFLTFDSLEVEAVPWSSADEAARIAESDIGIAWVPDDAWSRGKCGLKVLQYLAAGLPVVANPVGVQADLVRHGETGFLAETPQQWADAIGRLARDPDLRRRMGEAGRRLVEERYSVRAGAAAWLRILGGLSSVRRGA